jgi:CHAT domain/SIR2-like domain
MTQPEYLDCELRLADCDKACLVLGGREFSGRPALDDDRLQSLAAEIDPLRYGSELFEALLPPGSDLLAAYRGALMSDPRQFLRLRLHLAATAPAALHALRWELLYDPQREIPLSCSREIAFSRYCPVPERPVSPAEGTPRLLVAVANPSDLAAFGLPPVDPAAARAALEQALAQLDGVTWKFHTGPVTVAALRDRLLGGQFHALHLQAHGALLPGHAMAHVVLEGEDGRARFVDETAFSQVFEGLRDLRLATLISCHSGRQSNDAPLSGLGPGLVRRGVPTVLAMRQSISFEAAGTFCHHFYRNLARSGLVDQAANEARNQQRLAGRDGDEWSVPVLFMRLRDGRLWQPGSSGPDVGPEPPRITLPPDRDSLSSIKWPGLLESIQRDEIVPFLGPGVGRGLLPSPEEIAERLVAGRHLPLGGRGDLPAVSQFIEIKDGAYTPHYKLSAILAEGWLERQKALSERDRASAKGLGLSQVVERLAARHFAGDPDEPHGILADLPLSTYVTTNYDPFLAAALRRAGKRPLVERYPLRVVDLAEIPDTYKDLQSSPQEPLVFHMYGTDDRPASLVLTEDDYFDFVRATASYPSSIPMGLPRALKAKLSKAMLIFLGYDVRRLDCRVLLRGVVNPLNDPFQRDRIAVFQIDPQDAEAPKESELRDYIRGCCEKVRIKVYYGTVRDFLGELRKRLEGDHAPA